MEGELFLNWLFKMQRNWNGPLQSQFCHYMLVQEYATDISSNLGSVAFSKVYHPWANLSLGRGKDI